MAIRAWAALAICAAILNLVVEAKLNDTQIAAVRNAMKLVLKIDEPSEGVRNASKKFSLPKHMMELLDKIEAGETIRSVEPLRDFVPHLKDVMVYNLSALRKPEKMKIAQLHIFRRRLLPQKGHSRKRLLPPPCRVRLYQILNEPSSAEGDKELSDSERMKLRSLDSIPVPQGTKGGWYTIDISMALKEMMNSIGATNSLIFGVRFEGPRGKSISPQRFLKQPEMNASTSYIVIFSDDANNKESLSPDTFKLKMEGNQIDIMVELLENAAMAAMKSSERAKGRRKLKEDTDRNRHGKRKLKKTERIEDDKLESIRYGRKYYGNFANERRHDKKKVHAYSKATPGNGDIVELLDYERVKKIKALRRHNHNTINMLNLRYDTATKSVVPKKVDRPDYDEDRNETERSRKIRSIHDNELSDYVIEFSDGVTEVYPGKNKEDDMGDVSYYEPDVYLHEQLVPRKNKNRQRVEDVETNMALGEDDDYYKYDKTERPKKGWSYDLAKNTTRYNGKPRQEKRRHGQKKRTRKNKDSGKDKSECHLSHLTVDFREIGMYNVISPQTFEFGFCSGQCSSTKKNSTLKNYSLIQSLVKLVHQHKGIPDSCCVPSKTKPIVMLYMDHDDRRIINTYQEATVESCECR